MLPCGRFRSFAVWRLPLVLKVNQQLPENEKLCEKKKKSAGRECVKGSGAQVPDGKREEAAAAAFGKGAFLADLLVLKALSDDDFQDLGGFSALDIVVGPEWGMAVFGTGCPYPVSNHCV